ncbi:TolC family protein [Parabacteroides bouchesdurhonensis]|uniref:TolC family protein n=1 Tax=Parabacteroides bouchesdurhonensis TaxID=1936995 RepID=UPI000C844FE1|nr:TolC family protein [Parabacteroides bouchesdurhonensis]
MKQILLTTVLSCGLVTVAIAQEKTWTLDECMQYAVENSPAVKKQAYTHDTYKAEHNASIASFFPTASTSISAQYNFGRSIDPETNTYNNTSTFNNSYGLSTQIPVFTGGQLINQWLLAKSNVKMGKNDIQKKKDDLALETMEAYMNVVYYKGTIKMAADKLEESQRTLYKTKRQEELGLKGRADVAQFEAQVAADDYSLTHQQNLYNAALLTLKEKMNCPSDMELEVDTLLSDVSFGPMVENVNEIFDYASANNPTALQADYQLKGSKYQYRMYKGAMLPQIYFNAGISTNYFENLKSEAAAAAFGSQFKNNRGEYVGFSVSFPLFNGLSKVTNVRRYRNNLRIAEETKTEVLRQLQNAIEQSVLDREGYAKEAIQMDKQVKSNDLAYRVTLRKYEEGLMSSLDVQTSSNNLLTSKADLLQKKLMYLMKSKLVDYYKGKPLINGIIGK